MRQGFVDPVIIKQDSENRAPLVIDQKEFVYHYRTIKQTIFENKKIINLVRQFRLYGLKYFI